MKLPRFLCCAAVTLFAGAADAQDEKKAADAPKGAWKRQAGEFTLTFTFEKKNEFTFKMVTAGGDGMEFEAEYEKGEGDTISLTVSKSKSIGNFDGGPGAGEKYSFKAKFDGGTMTLSDLKRADGAEVEPEAQELVQGAYKRADD